VRRGFCVLPLLLGCLEDREQLGDIGLGSKPILREWRVTLMRDRGEFLGNDQPRGSRERGSKAVQPLRVSQEATAGGRAALRTKYQRAIIAVYAYPRSRIPRAERASASILLPLIEGGSSRPRRRVAAPERGAAAATGCAKDRSHSPRRSSSRPNAASNKKAAW
jgi:hypothetical protein